MESAFCVLVDMDATAAGGRAAVSTRCIRRGVFRASPHLIIWGETPITPPLLLHYVGKPLVFSYLLDMSLFFIVTGTKKGQRI